MAAKLTKSRFNRDNGQSLFEVVIALGISAIVVAALVGLTATSIRNATFSKNKTLAGRMAEEATEWLRGQRDQDVAGFIANSQTSVWCLSTLGWSNPGTCTAGDEIAGTQFMRELAFSEDAGIPEIIIEADVRVWWNDSQGEHEVRSATNFTDWRER